MNPLAEKLFIKGTEVGIPMHDILQKLAGAPFFKGSIDKSEVENIIGWTAIGMTIGVISAHITNSRRPGLLVAIGGISSAIPQTILAALD